jgi:hypothetical protein
MAGDPHNQQYVTPPFGMSPGIASTGSSGQPAADPDLDSAALMSGVVVSVPGQSSQVAPDTTTVHLGDTASASYGPVPPDGDPLTGLGEAFLNATGAGEGHVATSHPGSRA